MRLLNAPSRQFYPLKYQNVLVVAPNNSMQQQDHQYSLEIYAQVPNDSSALPRYNQNG
jgi:hypothetical protein